MTTERNAQGVDGLAEVMGLLAIMRDACAKADSAATSAEAKASWAVYDEADEKASAILRSHGEAIRELVEAAHRVLDYGLDTDTAMTGGEWTSAMDSRSNLRAALAKFPEPRP
jgi:hypothetical protein